MNGKCEYWEIEKNEGKKGAKKRRKRTREEKISWDLQKA